MSIFKKYFPLCLCLIPLSVQVLEVAHAEEPICEDLYCLVCHADMDEEQVSSNHFFKTNFIPTDFNLNHRALVLDRAPKALLPIRAPPIRSCE